LTEARCANFNRIPDGTQRKSAKLSKTEAATGLNRVASKWAMREWGHRLFKGDRRRVHENRGDGGRWRRRLFRRAAGGRWRRRAHFIARGAHLAALRDKGLTLNSANGDLHLQSVSATDDPAQIGPVDIVIFAVKQYDTESAARQIKPLIGTDTAAITLQNGMDKDERLRAVLGREHVMEGAAYIGAGCRQPVDGSVVWTFRDQLLSSDR
jgi:hypothetical protein